MVRRLAVRIGNIDEPVGTKIHTHATPLMGGVAVYVAFAAGVILFLPRSGAVVGVLAGGLAAVALGVFDELRTLPPLAHLVGQVGAAAVTIVAGVGVIHTVSAPWSSVTAPGVAIPAGVGVVITVFWLVGMMNTLNFLDGLDGLASGVSASACLLLALWAAEPQRYALDVTHHPEYLILPLALLGALLGFLRYNWNPASIFLGDSGSMFLGLAIGALAIVGPAKLGTALLILIVPVFDVAWAIVRRQLRGRSFLSGDKQHVYHRMIELGMSRTATVLSLYALCLSLAVLDLVFLKFEKLVAFIVLAILTSAAFVSLEWRASHGKRVGT